MALAAPVLLALRLAGDLVPPEPHTIEQLQRRFELEVVVERAAFRVETSHGSLTGRDPSPHLVTIFAPLLGEELGLYPAQLVRNAGLKRIVLCRDLVRASIEKPAVSDLERGTLYLDVAVSVHDDRYKRRLVHHELYHFVDWNDDVAYDDDGSWTVFNPPGFEYGVGGDEARYDPTGSLWTEELPGFVSRYGRCSIREDKAELWSFALVHPRELAQRAKADVLLAAKLDRMRIMASEFAPHADDAFWKGLEYLERPWPDRLERHLPK